MRNLIRLVLLASIAFGSLSAATVTFSVTSLGGNNYRYLYNLQGVSLLINQELDIVFETTRYASISNGVPAPNAAPGLDLALFQVNNPPGANGVYSLLATANNPSMIGPFSVDFSYIGTGTPGAQTFFINQLNGQGQIVNAVGPPGVTTQSTVPEPSTLIFGAAGLALIALGRFRRP